MASSTRGRWKCWTWKWQTDQFNGSRHLGFWQMWFWRRNLVVMSVIIWNWWSLDDIRSGSCLCNIWLSNFGQRGWGSKMMISAVLTAMAISHQMNHSNFHMKRPYSSVTWNSNTIPVSGMSLITAWAVATGFCISDVSSQWEGTFFWPPQLQNLGSDRSETQILETRPEGHPHMPNLFKIGLRVWAGPLPSLSRHLLLSFVFCILVTPSRSDRWTDRNAYGLIWWKCL